MLYGIFKLRQNLINTESHRINSPSNMKTDILSVKLVGGPCPSPIDFAFKSRVYLTQLTALSYLLFIMSNANMPVWWNRFQIRFPLFR